MTKEVQYVDKQGQPIQFRARSADALDVGFGGNMNKLMERLVTAKKVMEVAESKFPYEKTGIKSKGNVTSVIGNEGKEISGKDIDSTFGNVVTETSQRPSSLKDLREKYSKKKQVVEQNDEEYMYYNTGEVEDDVPEKRMSSLTSELLKHGGDSINKNMDVSGPISEQAFSKSKMPDFIKQSFKEKPIQAPSMSVALGGGQLDAMTEKMKAAGYIKDQTKQKAPSQPQRKVINENSIPSTKREKIKAQLRPIVEELIIEILAEKLLA